MRLSAGDNAEAEVRANFRNPHYVFRSQAVGPAGFDGGLVDQPLSAALVGEVPAFVVEDEYRILPACPGFLTGIEPQIRGRGIADEHSVAVKLQALALLRTGKDVDFDRHGESS
jgi:hypothetical protein